MSYRDRLAKLARSVNAAQYEVSIAGNRVMSLDVAKLYGVPDGLKTLCDAFCQAIETSIGLKSFKRIAIANESAAPFAATVAYSLKVPLIELDLHSRRIGGLMTPGDVILPIDTVVGMGDAPVRAVECISGSGGVVNDYFCILDEERGGAETLRKLNVQLRPLMTLLDISS